MDTRHYRVMLIVKILRERECIIRRVGVVTWILSTGREFPFVARGNSSWSLLLLER